MSIPKKTTLLLLAILLLASALRLYKLGSNPPGLDWDEASLGWNAYSILHTGRDEYGKFMPLTLQSFGDYKPALYAYYTIPSVAIFGLTEFAVRFPSAIFGIVGVLFMYLLVKRLFYDEWLGLIAAFVLAVSPWHLQFSHAAFEANAALTIILAATYFFLRGLNNWKWLTLSLSLFVITLYTYQSSRLFVPVLGLGLVAIYWRSFWPLKKSLIFPVVVAGILLIPFAVSMTDSASRSRLAVQSMFSYTRPPIETQALAKEGHEASQSAEFKLLHGQWQLWGRAIVEKEVNYLTPPYLFVTGDTGERQHTPDMGLEYWLWIPFYLAGFYFLFRKNLDKKAKVVLLFWLLWSPIPAVLSRDSTQSLRSLQEVFAVDLVIAIGLWGSYLSLKQKRRIFSPLLVVFALAFLFNFAFYLDSYYVHMPKRLGEFWLYGYKPAIEAIAPIYKNYNQVIFSTDYNEPYIYFLFYLKPDPRVVQQQIHLTATRGIDVGEVQHFQNITFRHIFWPTDRGLPNTLFVGTLEELPEKDVQSEKRATELGQIRNLNNSIAFRIVATSPAASATATPTTTVKATGKKK